MSLTSHLHDPNSPITRYLHQRYPYIGETMKRLHACIQVLKHTPPTRDTYPHWLIGQAIDYRIRFALEVPNLDNLWAGRGINHHAHRYGYFGDDSHEEWFHFLKRFFTLESETPQPLKHILAPPEEQTLIKYCLILGHFEAYARSGELKIRPRGTVEETLNIPWRDEVEDLYHLTQQFYTTCTTWLSLPVVCNPIFPEGDTIGGADGDIVVDRCLYDFKCSKKTRPVESWIYQMIGYVLLDTDQTFNSCGFYFPRHASLTQWKTLPWLQHLARDHALTIKNEQTHFIDIIETAAAEQ
jgi:hypothetical protein